jgi:SAM-dependent methyltransferase
MEQSVNDDLHAVRVLLSEQYVVDGRRFGPAKRFVMRGSRMITHRLVAAVGRLADAVQRVDDRRRADIDGLRGELASAGDRATLARQHADAVGRDVESRAEQRHEQALAELALANQRLQAVTAAVATQEAVVQSLQTRLTATEKAALYQRSELQRARTQVGRLSRAGSADTAPAPAVEWSADALDEQGYRDFEERFRGSRDEIRARQLDAVEYVRALRPGNGPLLDIACGRGEWLDILGAQGIEAYGVDSNAAMIADAAGAGLDVRHEDALVHLARLEESSLQGISAFHFVEHIPLGVLVQMLDDALLALRPDGILLFETPNPTNLMVGSASFYLDPTHLRPIHPEFLRFLVESRGFVDVEIHYVHPAVPAESMIESGPPGGYPDARLDRVVSAVEAFVYGPQDYVLTARRPPVAEPVALDLPAET